MLVSSVSYSPESILKGLLVNLRLVLQRLLDISGLNNLSKLVDRERVHQDGRASQLCCDGSAKDGRSTLTSRAA